VQVELRADEQSSVRTGRRNFDLPGASLNGLLTGAAGQINGTTRAGHNVDRVGVGTGVYALGASPPDRVRFAAHLLGLVRGS
jgi:hypothetical protein